MLCFCSYGLRVGCNLTPLSCPAIFRDFTFHTCSEVQTSGSCPMPGLNAHSLLLINSHAVALVYYFFDPHGITDDPHLSTVITTTLVVVLISILIFGAATKPLLAYLMGTDDGSSHGGWMQQRDCLVIWGGLCVSGRAREGQPSGIAGTAIGDP